MNQLMAVLQQTHAFCVCFNAQVAALWCVSQRYLLEWLASKSDTICFAERAEGIGGFYERIYKGGVSDKGSYWS